MSTISSGSTALGNLVAYNQPSTATSTSALPSATESQTVAAPLDNLVAWNQAATSSASTTSTSTTTQAQQGSTPTMPSALDDLIAWNQAATATSSTTTVAQAKQTVAQTPSTILSSLAPANSSIYSTTDSLLGNASTSSALSALAQVNATLPASSQINVFSSAADAASYGSESEASSDETLEQSALGSLGGSNSAVLAAYYANSGTSSDSSPQIDVTG